MPDFLDRVFSVGDRVTAGIVKAIETSGEVVGGAIDAAGNLGERYLPEDLREAIAEKFEEQVVPILDQAEEFINSDPREIGDRAGGSTGAALGAVLGGVVGLRTAGSKTGELLGGALGRAVMGEAGKEWEKEQAGETAPAEAGPELVPLELRNGTTIMVPEDEANARGSYCKLTGRRGYWQEHDPEPAEPNAAP